VVHHLLVLSATWLPALLAQAQDEVEGNPEDVRYMLSGVRLMGIVALILLIALIVWLIKKI
jgi:hypothetical protein